MDIFTKHPEWPHVKEICETLHKAGFVAWLAGGCVRDALLGVIPKDFDVATNASPEQIEKLFPKTVTVGKRFGVVRVIRDIADIEVATFRKDGIYEDGRRPKSVSPSTPEEDAKRRDFTINALFFDPVKDKIEDFVGGKADLHKHLIRTVGRPEDRFSEDRLRIMRAVRFVSQLDFYLDHATHEAIVKTAPQLTSVSWERIHDEMVKLLIGLRPDRGIALLEETGLFGLILPEVSSHEVMHHALKSLEGNEILGWTTLLSECSVKNRGYVYTRLKFSKEKKTSVEASIENYKKLKEFDSLKLADKKKWAAGTYAAQSLHLAHLNSQNNFEASKFFETHRSLPPPLVTANDLLDLGFKEGKSLGSTLAQAFDEQLNETIKSKSEAMEFARKKLEKARS